MKTLETDIQFYSRGAQGKINYEVASNAKVMKLLSDSLYSDKISAVIRELSTNAWDSHVDAHNLNPFNLKLPTHNDKEFKIRDFGTGMAPHDVERMYRTYGASDKTKTNNLQGCMGLGSKSPFCYTDLFSSITYYNGKKITWVNSKDKTGIPSLVRMVVEDTTEPNGFEVSFLVKSEHIEEFWTKARKIYSVFPILPNIIDVGEKEFAVYKPTPILKGDDWKIYDNKDFNRAFAIMGYVKYPIDIDAFSDHVDKKRPSYRLQQNKYQKLLSSPITLYFEIGDIDFDISRESLQYTDRTIETIKQKLDKVLDRVAAIIGEKLINCKSFWEAQVFYCTLFNSSFRNMKDVLGLTDVAWQNKPLSHSHINLNDLNLDSVCFKYDRYKNKVSRHLRNKYLYPTKNVKFFLNDMKVGSYIATQRFLEAEINNESNINEVWLFKGDDLSDLWNQLGILPSDLIKTSSLPKLPRAKRTKNAISQNYCFLLDKTQSSYYNKRRYWNKKEVELSYGGIYVEINNWYVDNKHPKNITHIINQLKKIGINTPDIYGIKTAKIKKFEKSLQWTTFNEWAKQNIRKLLHKTSYNKYIYIANNDISSSLYNILKNNIEDFKRNSPMFKFLSIINEQRNIRDNYSESVDTIIKISNELGIKIEEEILSSDNTSKIDVQKMNEDIYKRYEMLRFIGHYTNNVKPIITYVNLVDKEFENGRSVLFCE